MKNNGNESNREDHGAVRKASKPESEVKSTTSTETSASALEAVTSSPDHSSQCEAKISASGDDTTKISNINIKKNSHDTDDKNAIVCIEMSNPRPTFSYQDRLNHKREQINEIDNLVHLKQKTGGSKGNYASEDCNNQGIKHEMYQQSLVSTCSSHTIFSSQKQIELKQHQMNSLNASIHSAKGKNLVTAPMAGNPSTSTAGPCNSSGSTMNNITEAMQSQSYKEESRVCRNIPIRENSNTDTTRSSIICSCNQIDTSEQFSQFPQDIDAEYSNACSTNNGDIFEVYVDLQNDGNAISNLAIAAKVEEDNKEKDFGSMLEEKLSRPSFIKNILDKISPTDLCVAEVTQSSTRESTRSQLSSDNSHAKKRIAFGIILLFGIISLAIISGLLLGGFTKKEHKKATSSSLAVTGNSNEVPIAVALDTICNERIPGLGRSEICTPEETTKHGGGVGNLVANARLTQFANAQISILNSGGIRSDIIAGPFTKSDAAAVLPFDNTIVLLQMTYEEIHQVLEDAIEYMIANNGTGAYPYTAGIRYDVDLTANYMKRFINIEINPYITAHHIYNESQWTPIERYYGNNTTVITCSFLALGNDGYTTFGKVTGNRVTWTSIGTARNFIDYASAKKELKDLPLSQYSTKSLISGSYLRDRQCEEGIIQC